MNKEIKNIVSSHRQHPFTSVSNVILTCPEISSKAFRVYCYLCSKVNMQWEFYNYEMAKNMDFSEWTLKGILKELEDLNLIQRIYHRDSNSRYTKREIIVRLEVTKEELEEFIKLKNKNSKNSQSLDIVESEPLVDFPPVAFPPVENPPTYKRRTKEKKNKEKSLPTMNEIKEECEREKYFIDEEKFFKWCCKVGDLKSSWQSVLMNWAQNPINKVLPKSKNPPPFVLELGLADTSKDFIDSSKKWQKLLQENFEKDVFDKWIKYLIPHRRKGEKVIFSVKGKFVRDWITREYQEEIENLLDFKLTIIATES